MLSLFLPKSLQWYLSYVYFSRYNYCWIRIYSQHYSGKPHHIYPAIISHTYPHNLEIMGALFSLYYCAVNLLSRAAYILLEYSDIIHIRWCNHFYCYLISWIIMTLSLFCKYFWLIIKSCDASCHVTNHVTIITKISKLLAFETGGFSSALFARFVWSWRWNEH